MRDEMRTVMSSDSFTPQQAHERKPEDDEFVEQVLDRLRFLLRGARTESRANLGWFASARDDMNGGKLTIKIPTQREAKAAASRGRERSCDIRWEGHDIGDWSA